MSVRLSHVVREALRVPPRDENARGARWDLPPFQVLVFDDDLRIEVRVLMWSMRHLRMVGAAAAVSSEQALRSESLHAVLCAMFDMAIDAWHARNAQDNPEEM